MPRSDDIRLLPWRTSFVKNLSSFLPFSFFIPSSPLVHLVYLPPPPPPFSSPSEMQRRCSDLAFEGPGGSPHRKVLLRRRRAECGAMTYHSVRTC